MDFLLQLAAMLFSAGAVYAGIRGDLKMALKDAAEAKESSAHAHTRIDRLLERRRQDD